MLSLSLWRLLLFCVLKNDKSTSGKSTSNIPPAFKAYEPQQQHYTWVLNAHERTTTKTTLYMSYTSFFIHQPQLNHFNSNQPFLFYSIERLRDCSRRIRTFLHLVHFQNLLHWGLWTANIATLAPKVLLKAWWAWLTLVEPDLPAFDNYQLKLMKAWLSLVLPGFQGKPGYNLPWRSGNSGLYLKILTRNAWLVWYYQAFLVGLVEIFHLKSLVSLV